MNEFSAACLVRPSSEARHADGSPGPHAIFPGNLAAGKSWIKSASALRFLVVDDNESFLQLLCDMLHSLGHRTQRARSAEDAARLVAQEPFDILLSDINLPGMSGIELAKIAAEAAPDIRIIFSSGFGYMVPEALDFDFSLLHKPYFINQLKQAIG